MSLISPLRGVVKALLTLGACVSSGCVARTVVDPVTESPRAERAIGYYDEALRRVVLVGGTGVARAAARDRVWSWSGRRWELVTDSGPAARSNAGGGYDARGRRGVVTGGMRRTANDSAFEVIAATWQGSARNWRPLGRSEAGARDHNAMAYDERRSALIMFGGMPATRSASWPTDTWQLGDEGWARLATDGPSGRARTAMAYDRTRAQVVLFGGVGASPAPGQPQPFYDDTWIFDQGAWRNVMPGAGGPRGRYAHAMVFDERAGVTLLYSGAAAHRNAPLRDMWRWDGTRWTEIPLTGATPGFRYQPVMVYDRARRKTVLYGGQTDAGFLDDTWEWDGRSWKQISAIPH